MIVYYGDKYNPNTDIVAAKILFNSAVAAKLSKFLGINLMDFYLESPLVRHEYMLVPLTMIPNKMVK